MDLEKALEANPHLGAYLEEHSAAHPMPEFHERLGRDMKSVKRVNVLYPVGDPIFIHIWDDEESGQRKYVNIEPVLTDVERPKYQAVRDRTLRLAPFEPTPKNQDDLRQTLRKHVHATAVHECVVGAPG